MIQESQDGAMARYPKLDLFSRSKWALVSVLAIAFLARAVYVRAFDLRGLHTPFNYMLEDEKSYDWMAQNLLEHGSLGYRGEPSARRGPGYPLFLAAIYSVAGRDFTVVRWLQVVLDALTAVLVVLVLRISGEPLAGWFSGLAYALYPIFVYNSAEIMTEALILPFSVLLAYFFVRLVAQRAGLRYAFLAGLVAGAMFLVRENNILLPIPLALVLWLALRRARPEAAVRGPILLLIGFALLWTPWVARNYAVFGELSFGGSTGGENLIRNMNMAVHGMDYDKEWTAYRRKHGLVVYHEFHDPALTGRSFPDEWESDRKTKRLAWEMIRRHPGAMIEFGVRKLGWMLLHLDPHRKRAQRPGLRLAVAWIYRCLAIVGLWGLVVAVRRRHWPMLGVLGCYVAPALFLLFTMPPFVRYRYVALDLAFVLLSGLALSLPWGARELPPRRST